MVRHFGIFEFNDNINDDTIEKCFTAMESMVGQIRGLLSFEYGPYNSTEGLNEGYTHGFIMTFSSESDRDLYLRHSFHEEIKKVVVPRLARVIVFDFTVEI